MQLKTATAAFIIIAIIIGAGMYYAGFSMAPRGTIAIEKTVTVTATAGAAPPRTILIGGTLPITGFYSPIVTPAKFMEALFAVVNERGGIYVKEYGQSLPVKFVYYDDKSDLETALRLTERLITVDKVDLLVSTYSAPIGLAEAKVAERNQVPMVLAESWSQAHYEANLKWSVYFQGNYWEVGSGNWFYTYFKMLKEQTSLKTVGVVGVDGDWARDVYRSAVNEAKSEGFQVVYTELMPVETQDFTATITKLRSANPDVVVVSGWAPINVGFLKQMRDLNYRPKELHVSEYGAEFVDALGSFAERVTAQMYWYETSNAWGSDLIREALRRSDLTYTKFQYTALRTIVFQLAFAGIEQAGTLDKAKVNDALHHLQIMTIDGPLYIHENGLGTVGMIVAQIQNGKLVTVYPAESATAKYIPPGP